MRELQAEGETVLYETIFHRDHIPKVLDRQYVVKYDKCDKSCDVLILLLLVTDHIFHTASASRMFNNVSLSLCVSRVAINRSYANTSLPKWS